MPSPSSPAAHDARPPLGLVVLLGSMTAFGAVSIDLYLPAVPTLRRALDASPGQAELTIAAFILGMAFGQLVYGPLSDRHGRRPPLFAGLAIYIAASIGCAVAPTIELLMLGRLAQGLGGCAAIVVARAAVRDRYDDRQTARVFSYLMLVLGVAPVLAPLAGSLLLAAMGWRAIFAVLAAFGVVMFVAAWFGLAESVTTHARRATRTRSALATYAALLRSRRLLGYTLAGACTSASLFSYVASSATLFIDDFGQTPTMFSWLFALNAIALIGASQLNRSLLRRHPPDAISAVALRFAAVVGVVFAAAAWAGFADLWVSFAFLFLLLGAFGFVAGNLGASALGVDPGNAGSIAALTGGVAFAVGAAVAALVGALHDGSARPLASAMALAFVLAWLAFARLARGA